MPSNPKDVIVACDFPTREETLRFLDSFAASAKKPYVKIGMELYYSVGPDIVREIKDRGHNIFLDLKLHDIPNTVGRTMKTLGRLGVNMTNLHAAGGSAMMRAAKEGLAEGAAAAGNDSPVLIAVTILTSIGETELHNELLIPGTVGDVVAAYAGTAQMADLDGVVCSPLEAALVKEHCGAGFATVTPGIRYPEGDTADQSRVTTPGDAARIGSDYIVVGRPVTAAKDPVAAYARIVKDFTGETV